MSFPLLPIPSTTQCGLVKPFHGGQSCVARAATAAPVSFTLFQIAVMRGLVRLGMENGSWLIKGPGWWGREEKKEGQRVD